MATDPNWSEQAERILARLRTACGHRAVRIDHRFHRDKGMDARDIIDVQITVDSLQVADELSGASCRQAILGSTRWLPITASTAEGLLAQTFPRLRRSGPPPTCTCESTDNPTSGSPCCSSPGSTRIRRRGQFLEAKRLAERTGDYSTGRWLRDAYSRATAWAGATDWSPGTT